MRFLHHLVEYPEGVLRCSYATLLARLPKWSSKCEVYVVDPMSRNQPANKPSLNPHERAVEMILVQAVVVDAKGEEHERAWKIPLDGVLSVDPVVSLIWSRAANPGEPIFTPTGMKGRAKPGDRLHGATDPVRVPVTEPKPEAWLGGVNPGA